MGLHSSQWRVCLFLVGCSAAAGCTIGRVAADELPGAAKEQTAAQQLFDRHCAACHGQQGDGNGLASVFLFPKPRNLRAGRFRLVSTANSVPTRNDLHALLVRGMPGSSMPSWAHLSEQELNLLVEQLQQLLADGARDRYVRTLQEQEQLTDEELQDPEVQAEIREFVEQQTTPGELTEVPAAQAASAESIARGKELYVRQSCHSCHGNEAKGDGVQKMIDEEGFPTRSRDLTRGIYKGGDDFASLFRRIRYGMPGTPMPASTNLQPDQIADMIHFLRSLSTEEQRRSVVLQRRQLTARRLSQLPVDDSHEAWKGVAVVSIQTFPLWWRDNAEVDLRLQVAHDGRSFATRLSWNDQSQNVRAVHSGEFEDMIALQLFSGTNEPFLGMGGSERVDLWQWRAGSASEAERDSLLDDYPFDTPVYREFFGDQPSLDFRTGRVVGNPLSVRAESASSLIAEGLGSTTFRPQASQAVTASATWRGGRWTVVLRRPLVAPGGADQVLQPGQPYSAAFAVWDGEFQERGGQKQISIWNDLRLE